MSTATTRTSRNDEAQCGADPCCGQRNTAQGCIFAPKILGTVPDKRGGVGTSVARIPRYEGDPEPWIDAADTEHGGRYEESEVDAGRS